MQKSDEDDSSMGGPDAAVYAGHGGGIIEVLSDLLDKADTQLDGLRKAETASVQNFEVLAQNLNDEIKFGNADISEAKKSMASSGSLKAEAEGDLQATSKDLASDETE